jgi:hypothetical protein
VHATLRARNGIPSLRLEPAFCDVSRALAACSGGGFSVIHFSIQSDHLHLIVEATTPGR